jgi:hypothetical protein
MAPLGNNSNIWRALRILNDRIAEIHYDECARELTNPIPLKKVQDDEWLKLTEQFGR